MKNLKRKLLSQFKNHITPMEQLKTAIEKGHHKKAANLILQIGNINNEGGILPPLWIAISSNNAVAVEALLDAGANPNKGTIAIKYSPFEMAVNNGFIKVAAILAERGADLKGTMYSRKDSFLNIILSKALDENKPSTTEEKTDYLRLIKAVIKNGDKSQLNRINRKGFRPIEQLTPEVFKNEFVKQIANELIRYGAKLNPQLKKQLTEGGVINKLKPQTFKALTALIK